MTIIIDRRKNPNGKNLDNRQRFIKRISSDVKRSINDAIKDRKIADVGEGENIRIPSKDISEPTFRSNKKTGDKWIINPGNKQFNEGDKVKKPPSGGGKGGPDKGDPSNDPEKAEDDFVFTLTKDEFLDFFFEDLELPDLIKTKLKEIHNMKFKRAGFTNFGNPSSLNVLRTMKQSLGRRIALKRPKTEEIELLETEIDFNTNLLNSNMLKEPEKGILLEKIEELKLKLQILINKSKRIPYIDPLDLRYNLFLPSPQPNTQAAMFCIMDVSGSMGEREKDLSKRFFILLYMFLKRRYDKVELVFLRHHTTAEEVDEQEFFYGKETGGTVVSSSIKLMQNIIEQRYPLSDWNIYAAQASDGDNYGGDSKICVEMFEDKLLGWLQYFAYVQIDRDTSPSLAHFALQNELWKSYKTLADKNSNFAMKRIKDRKDIFPVFRELFTKEKG